MHSIRANMTAGVMTVPKLHSFLTVAHVWRRRPPPTFLTSRPAAGAPAEAWFRVGGRRGGISGARPSALKALLQHSSLHELLAVLQASHQFVVRAACRAQPSSCSGAKKGSHTADRRHVVCCCSASDCLCTPVRSNGMSSAHLAHAVCAGGAGPARHSGAAAAGKGVPAARARQGALPRGPGLQRPHPAAHWCGATCLSNCGCCSMLPPSACSRLPC